MTKLFGTDGTRGIAVTDLNCELAMQTARAAAAVLASGEERHTRIIVGKDTRLSSNPLEDAVIAGIRSVGADAELLGVVPVPAVAYMVKQHNADGGIMISGSQNNPASNGIKIFNSLGQKLSDEQEETIERLVLEAPGFIPLAPHDDVGRISYYKQAADDYVEHIKEIAECSLKGMKIALDCANGCASETAEKLFSAMGAEVFVMANTPDGSNINKDCGAGNIEPLIEFLTQNNCDCGFAFDGDADRCIAVDEKGGILDGDKLLAVFAEYFKRYGMLKNNTAVITIMTNMGLNKFAESKGFYLVRAGAGHRYVLERMLEGGYNLGGEPSGHIVFLDDSTTGDGQLTALKLLKIMKTEKKKLSELASDMVIFPQVMLNIKIEPQHRERWKNYREITEMIEKYAAELGSSGRIVVRESGTEDVIRVMTEGSDFSRINEMAFDIAQCIKKYVSTEQQRSSKFENS